IRPPTAFRPKVTYERLDVRDAAAARELLAAEQPDALVHLAFVLNPMHDERTMYEIDVGGTHNVLEAASAAGTQQVLVTSSATATSGSSTCTRTTWGRRLSVCSTAAATAPSTSPATG